MDEQGQVYGGTITVRDIGDRKRNEEERRASEETLRVISDAALDGVILMDSVGKVRHWNSAAERIFGYTREEILGRDLHQLLAPPQSRELYEQVRPHFLKTGQGAAVGKVLELEGLHKDGHLFPVELSVAAVQLRGEWNAVGVVRDITDRKGAERSIRLLSEAVEQCPASVVITNRKGSIVYVNRKFCDITGYTSEEVLGKNPRLLKSGETSAETYQQLWKCITEGRVWQCEFHNRKKNGELFWESASISPVFDDQGCISNFVAVKEDITEHKLDEATLVQRAKELDRSNKELEQFAYVASHDLQEPLRMVSSYTQLLARRYKGKLDANADDFIAFAVDGAQPDADADQRPAGVLPRRDPWPGVPSYRLHELFWMLLWPISGRPSRRAARSVDRGPLPTVVADKVQFGQLFQNLVGNALKYHGEQPVRVQISAERKGSEWVFAVRDNGIGIDPQYAERIFVIFHACTTGKNTPARASAWPSARRSSNVTGGRISVESQARQRRHILLHGSYRKGRPMSTAAPGRPFEILLVEDNPGDIRLTKETLDDSGSTLQPGVRRGMGSRPWHFSAVRASTRASLRPDLILLDLNLPKKDGREVLAEIKLDPELKRIPVVILSTSGSQQDILNDV